MKKIQHQWRFKNGRYIHDADCYFWGSDICTCGLIHHFTMPVSDEDDPEWYDEESIRHEIQLSRMPERIPYVPPTKEELEKRQQTLEKLFPGIDINLLK